MNLERGNILSVNLMFRNFNLLVVVANPCVCPIRNYAKVMRADTQVCPYIKSRSPWRA